MKIHYIKSPGLIIKGIGTHSVWVLRTTMLDSFSKKTHIQLCGYPSLESYIASQSNFLQTDGVVVDTSNMEVIAGSLEPQLLTLCVQNMPQFSTSTVEFYESSQS